MATVKVYRWVDVNEVYQELLKARRPVEFFGDVPSDELSRRYKECAKLVHPDKVTDSEKYIANEAFIVLNRLYAQARDEMSKGIYAVIDLVQLYKNQTPMFSLDIKGATYSIHEHVCEGDVATVFKGVCNNNIVYLKIAKDPVDNKLLEAEFKVLQKMRHASFPFVEQFAVINGCSAIFMREAEGTHYSQLMNEYPKGVPDFHVGWMMARLLSAVGYLHSNCIIHGNIKPEHIIVNKPIHNVSLVGFSWCLEDANNDDARYRVSNEHFTAPEVSKTATVTPSSDIYSVGKVAVALLGGDVATGTMPSSVPSKMQDFIRMLLSDVRNRPNDAWRLWDTLIQVRKTVYGPSKFKVLA